MNGARTTFMRRGYLLTALAAAVLLAASPGSASAQISIGFTESGGSIREDAPLNADALKAPQMITVRVDGITATTTAARIAGALGTVTVSAVGADIALFGADGTLGTPQDGDPTASPPTAASVEIPAARFGAQATGQVVTEVTLLVKQDNEDDNNLTGAKDGNWVNETIQVKLNASGSANLGTNIFNLTIEDQDMAPVVSFDTASVMLNEGNVRTVALDVHPANRRAVIPAGVASITNQVTVRVSNHEMVMIGECPGPTSRDYGKYSIGITGADAWNTDDLASTGLIQTEADGTDPDYAIDDLADLDEDPPNPNASRAAMTITACGDAAGIRDREVTLTILDRGLTDTTPRMSRGNIEKGPPLMITVNSDEAAPTLSFSPTDVTIDEGGSTETVLLAEGMNATEVGMVKLMVEGDAMVSLMMDGEMLEEMDGYVMVDMGSSNSARLMAMSHSDPDLMDGDMAYKAWKLTEDSTDVNIGDGYWFRVDVRGSTAVPALPLVGQLLLALFLMAGGSRLYRRRQG